MAAQESSQTEVSSSINALFQRRYVAMELHEGTDDVWKSMCDSLAETKDVKELYVSIAARPGATEANRMTRLRKAIESNESVTEMSFACYYPMGDHMPGRHEWSEPIKGLLKNTT